jgi:hypothetical protein
MTATFAGSAQALYFYPHGCLRVMLRGTNAMTGEPTEHTFDAPELEHITAAGRAVAVPPGSATGGPHDRAPVPRPGPR